MHVPLKKIIAIGITVSLLGVLAFPAPAHAQAPWCAALVYAPPLALICASVTGLFGFDLSAAGGFLDPVVEGFAHLFVGAIISIPAFIFFVVAGTANWIIRVVVSTPVIPGQGVGFVDQGFDFTRQFVNIFFLVILVFIGLATILRFREYELQRTLPRLIFSSFPL